MTMPFDRVWRITALRRELAHAEQDLRERAQRAAVRFARNEHEQRREAQDSCHTFDRIRPQAEARLKAILAGDRAHFLGERRLAEMAICDADCADASYTLLSFANLHDRLRYLRGGPQREAVIREAIERGGVYTAAYGGRHFQGIVR